MPRLTARAQQGVVEAWAEFTRDPSFYGLAGKLFIDAADHAMKAGLNSYAALFLNEAINAKKVAGVPEEEIFVLKQTICDLTS